jgi:hypothetical protein
VHDPEKWEPVSRLREALAQTIPSAGEGTSEKDDAPSIRKSVMTHRREVITL